MATENLSTTERLASCALIRTRFAGRAELERSAMRSRVSLAKLEVRLGLATEDAILVARRERATILVTRLTGIYREAVGVLLVGEDYETREAQASREYALARSAARVAVAQATAPWLCDQIDVKRTARKALAAATDPIAARQPGHIIRVIALRRAREQVARCSFRTATHGHSEYFVRVVRGQEGASSDTVTDWPNRLGVSVAASYKYRVTQSTHTWRVSPASLDPEVRALNDSTHKAVYLSYDVRVVQGRGTSLTVQRRGSKGGWA